MKRFLRYNGLSIVFLLLFILTMVGQSITGFKEHNNDLQENRASAITFAQYLTSGHFVEATFENFESEFLQMALYVILSIYFYQKGSAESKDPDKKNEVDREPDPKRKGAPWPVKKGGFILYVYKHSLCYALSLLFIISFIFHLYGSHSAYNEEQALKHLPLKSVSEYLGSSKFWFESFQNWQSEFLSIFAIVILSIFLREKGSAQSKPVDAPDSETD